MKTEHSAGGVVLTHQLNPPKILLIKDKSGKWTFPKGLIKKNESRISAASREIKEETGIKTLYKVCKFKPITYFYKWEGNLVKKSVDYFLFTAKYTPKLKPQISEGILATKWFTLTSAFAIIGYRKTNLPILIRACLETGKSKVKQPHKSLYLKSSSNVKRTFSNRL